MEERPPGVAVGQLGQPDSDLLFTFGTDAPGTFVGVDPQHPGHHRADRLVPAQTNGFRPGGRPGKALGKVLPPVVAGDRFDGVMIGRNIGLVGGDQRRHQLGQVVLHVGSGRSGR